MIAINGPIRMQIREALKVMLSTGNPQFPWKPKEKCETMHKKIKVMLSVGNLQCPWKPKEKRETMHKA